MKNRTESLQQGAEELIENIRSLIQEAESAIADGLAEKSETALASLRERLEAGLEKLNEYYEDAKEQVAAGAKVTDKTIRAHPYESIAIGLSLGVLIGLLIRPRR